MARASAPAALDGLAAGEAPSCGSCEDRGGRCPDTLAYGRLDYETLCPDCGRGHVCDDECRHG